ncbi:iron-containing alcohol dehydrogenase [Rhodobacterales bacterium HKCCE3408]|nr:iron-containing alcohol dehydrogenase [Rhodobacterales bacterium HKCCE3408]
MTPVATWSYPTEVRFGAGRISELAEACIAAGMTRPLLVTDRGLSGLPITTDALDLLDRAGLGAALFDGVDANPTGENLVAGLDAYRAGGHDGVVAFGGGSGLDLGKLVAFMSGQTRPVWDFEDVGDNWTRADPNGIAPVVAVPTTAGTGSEVGRAGVLTDAATHSKKIIFHPKMLPRIVIGDPALTVDLPRAITAGTGMDAFAHCLEAYSSPHFHPMSAGIALEGMRLVFENLPRAVETPQDLDARAQMMAAAMMGAVAFQKGLGAIHALSHPIGALYGTHHGTTNAVVLQPVLAFNRPAIEEKIARAAAYLGIAGGFDGFAAAVADLSARIGIPDNLTAMGVTAPDKAAIVAGALADPSTGGNPVPMTPEATAKLVDALFP